MAELVNPIGQIRGKIGNVIGYVGANGKNYCKGAELTRKPAGESQKQKSIAFGTMAQEKRCLAAVIRLGFPGGNDYPKGGNGFVSANVPGAVTVEQINPDKPISRRRKAAKEFRGVIDYEKLRVAAGSLVSPESTIEVDEVGRTVSFCHQGALLNLIDCFLTDKIYGVLFCTSNHRCRVEELGTRGETFTIQVNFPEDARADELAVYVFATNADGKEVSDSVCLRVPGIMAAVKV